MLHGPREQRPNLEFSHLYQSSDDLGDVCFSVYGLQLLRHRICNTVLLRIYSQCDHESDRERLQQRMCWKYERAVWKGKQTFYVSEHYLHRTPRGASACADRKGIRVARMLYRGNYWQSAISNDLLQQHHDSRSLYGILCWLFVCRNRIRSRMLLWTFTCCRICSDGDNRLLNALHGLGLRILRSWE